MEKKNFDIIYVAMTITIIAQILLNKSVLIGQCLFLVANIIYLARDFKLGRPKGDKIKNTAFTAITLGLIIAILIK